MMQNITVPETAWPKDFNELKLIDDALRCGICYDYIKTCMVTPCAHSYCSICIRRSLLYKAACPTCFEETYETNLRNNRVLDRVCELFVSIRDKLLKHLRIAAVHFNCNEQLQSPAPPQSHQKGGTVISDATPKRNNHKPSKASTSKGKLNFTTSIGSTTKSDISKRLEDILGSPKTNERLISETLDDSVKANESDLSKIPVVPPMFLQPKIESLPKIDIPTVPCPVCGVNIPERNINTHLDNCLANADKPPVKSPVKARPKRNPLPKMVWLLMAEKDLRKKLKDYGLNTQGDKKTLISRLQRYILLFNSECDSDHPRPVSEIIRQVEREEKHLPSQNQQRLTINSKSDPKVIEEENNKYIQENKDSFKKLIEAMRGREGKNIKPVTRPANIILSDDEDDINGTGRAVELSKQISSKKSTRPNPSSSADKSINLCESDDEDEVSSSASPVLDSWVPPRQEHNGYDSESSDSDIPILNNRILETVKSSGSSKNTFEQNKIDELCTNRNSPILDDDSFCNTSPPRGPSPCIIAAHSSDSEESFSILNNHSAGEDCLDLATEPVTEDLPDCNSQLNDPDFVANTELENEENSEEMFIPQRRSKRKLQSSVVAENHPASPRRTRRRLSK